MEFIDSEVVADNDQQLLSDSEEEQEKITDELDDFIENSSESDEGVSFNREVHNNPFKFYNQNKNSHDAILECDNFLYKTEDIQPELYDPISRNLVVFDKFASFKKSVEKF